MESYTTTKSSILKITEDNPKPNRHQQSTIDSLLNYIPINQLNRVHKILLENRGKGFEEKLRFLKSFEKKLLKIISSVIPEITFRTAVIPARKKRGSSWDDHDTHIGFPSLEGALLAISFLTFAIYLIRLIMMLLKNLGSNATTPNTILVNRNKRFATKLIEERILTEEAIRIHNYLHEFDVNMKE
ncbi:uncharacterized protein LOC103571800 isoform X2 [Microplitis demolitor]|nr:uncharacterized protein LOC103571800 isoform X2 [Microplitis demolitor]XP_053598284.1 uncharacterized protein LOC103571800 isoform X2 [Microplitis demolitor]XP_053598285.1 uncharacterized protein LOC103571800 isoform X2 [Microplitis demolitor]